MLDNGRVARVKRLALLPILVLALVASGCGDDDDEASGTTATAAAETCSKDQLALVTSETLTIGTDNPAFPPWFEGGTPDGSTWEINDPATGEGFESAVAYAVAEKLGFADDEVTWVVVPFNNSFKPGPKKFDFDINQISVTDERDQAVDFSDSYYDVNQALVVLNGTPIADATSLADLKQYQLGAQIGTTSLGYINDSIQPDKDPRVYDTSNDVIAAINAKQIDGLVATCRRRSSSSVPKRSRTARSSGSSRRPAGRSISGCSSRRATRSVTASTRRLRN